MSREGVRLVALGTLLSKHQAVCSALAPLFPRGSPACPCINPWANKLSPFTEVSTAEGDQTCLRTDWGACYPSSYGYGILGECKAWDSGLPATAHESGIRAACDNSTLSQPQYCRTPWCWVDPANCDRPNSLSGVFTNLTHTPTYSYHTCGYTNNYATDWRANALIDKTFRVSFPGDDDSGYTILTDSSGYKQGSYVEFMNRLAKEYGFRFVAQEVSSTSKAMFASSSFTACVHDVAINHTDLCIGNFWLTSERRGLTTMSAPISADDFYLVTHISDAESSTEFILRQVFQSNT